MNKPKGILAIACILLFACIGYASDVPTNITQPQCSTVVEKAELSAIDYVCAGGVTTYSYLIVAPITCPVYLDLCARIKHEAISYNFTPQQVTHRFNKPPSKGNGYNYNYLHSIAFNRYVSRQKIV